jgi:hypothetical protein
MDRRERSKSPIDSQHLNPHELKKVKREREEDRDTDNDKSDSELVVDDHNDTHGGGPNQNMNNGNGQNGQHNGLSSRSPHENGNGAGGMGPQGGPPMNNNGHDLMQNAKNMKKEENSRSPHSDNSSRSTPSIKVG